MSKKSNDEKNIVVPKEATCSFLHDYLCFITTGKLCDTALVDIFPLTNLTKSSLLQNENTQSSVQDAHFCQSRFQLFRDHGISFLLIYQVTGDWT